MKEASKVTQGKLESISASKKDRRKKTKVPNTELRWENQSKSHQVRRALSLDVPRITLYPYIPRAPFPASGQMSTLNLTAADQHGPRHHNPVEVMPRLYAKGERNDMYHLTSID